MPTRAGEEAKHTHFISNFLSSILLNVRERRTAPLNHGRKKMNEGMYLVGVYSMAAYTVGELERMLDERFGDKSHEVVCDVANGLVRVFSERERET